MHTYRHTNIEIQLDRNNQQLEAKPDITRFGITIQTTDKITKTKISPSNTSSKVMTI